jgi:drug/metabolite transporter (DMT)-like permease
MTLDFGVGLALACAALTQLAFLFKHRGANSVPSIQLHRPLASARALLASPWFAGGMAIAAGAWVLHVGALAMAPISTVQAVLSTGVVILAVLGGAFFGCRVTRRQWAGVGMTATGLVLLTVTVPAHDGAGAGYGWPAMVAFEAGMLAVGALLIAAPRLGAPSHHHGALLGAAAGVLFGVSDVALKALTEAAHSGLLHVVASPWILVAGIAAVLAFLASARGFQQGDAVPVIASTSTGANVTCIVGGVAVFGDPLAGGALIVVQVAAFGLVGLAALVTPAGHGPAALAD